MRDIKAVITGDFIGSSDKSATQLDRAMAVLEREAERLSWQVGKGTRFTRYRGDGWQIYLDFPGLCLAAVLQIAAALRVDRQGMVTRQSIGLGRVSELPASDLSAARGEAFEISGHQLDQMRSGERIVIGGRDAVTPWHEAIVEFAAFHTARWTPEQAEAMELYLRHDQVAGDVTQTELAAELGITRQAFQARLAGAGLPAWKKALYAFQSSDWEVLPDA